jgi:serine/threonine protein kinase
MEVFGTYRLLRPLGQGGLGVVHLAEPLRQPGPVVLKIAHPEVARDLELARCFRAAYELAGKCTHSSLVQVHGYGIEADLPFLVFEYIPGGDLAAWLRQNGRMPLDRAVAFFRPLCDGVAALHAAGIVHGALKPTNLLFDDAGKPKIADLGLGAPLHAAVEPERCACLAPEQFDGATPAATADIFGLAATLYMTLTGHPPHRFGSYAEALDCKRRHELIAFTDVAEPIERLLRAAFDPDPSRRPPLDAFRAGLDT